MGLKYKITASLCALVWCTSASVAQSQRPSKRRPFSLPPPYTDMTGKFDGTTYTNKFFGFTLTLPQGWQPQDASVQQQFMEKVRQKAQLENTTNQVPPQTSMMRTTSLFLIVKPIGGEIDPIIFAMAENIAMIANMHSPQQYLERMRLASLRPNSPLLYEESPTKQTIGGVEFGMIEAILRNPTSAALITARLRYYATLRKNHALLFLLIYDSHEQLQACLDVVNSLKFQ